ncbi:MAG: CsbD family protein [Propionibacteriaceae bacterium]|nr:CsbD family protein [Propionibacteriaceae bacterium]
MGIEDKARHTAEDLQGKVKEGWGKLTDDERLEAEGQLDQAKAKAKKAAEDLKDGVNDALRGD